MLGAIIGDIVGSPYEFESEKIKTFELFTDESQLTDDSLMTIAVGCACAKADMCNEEDFKSWVVYYMRKIGRPFLAEKRGRCRQRSELFSVWPHPASAFTHALSPRQSDKRPYQGNSCRLWV